MAQEKVKIRSLYVAQESTFGTDPSVSGALYKYLHAEAEMPKFGYELVANTLQNDRLVASPPDIGVQKASLALKVPLRGSGTPAGNATSAIAAELDEILTAIFGTVTRGQGSTVTAAWCGRDGQRHRSAGFLVGGVVWASQTETVRRAVEAERTSVTVAPTPGTPITTGRCTRELLHACGQRARFPAFHAKVGGVAVTLLGGRVTAAKISGMKGGEKPMLEVGFEFDSWNTTAKGSLPAADDRFPTVRAPIVKGGLAVVDTSTLLVAGVDVDLGVKTAYVESTEAAQGRSGFEVVDREIKGSFEPYYASQLMTDLAAGTDKGVGFATPSQTNGFGFYLPKARWLDHELDDRSGVLGVKLPFGAFDNGSSAEFVFTVA
jgi:hypothetical protein